MNEPVYDVTEQGDSAPSGRRAAKENTDPLYEPPGYLPSSYQAVSEPVSLKPKFDEPAPAPSVAETFPSQAPAGSFASAPPAVSFPSAPPVGSFPSTPPPLSDRAASASSSMTPDAPAQLPVQVSVTESATQAESKPPAPSTEYLQSLPAPTQAAPVQKPVQAAQPVQQVPVAQPVPAAQSQHAQAPAAPVQQQPVPVQAAPAPVQQAPQQTQPTQQAPQPAPVQPAAPTPAPVPAAAAPPQPAPVPSAAPAVPAAQQPVAPAAAQAPAADVPLDSSPGPVPVSELPGPVPAVPPVSSLSPEVPAMHDQPAASAPGIFGSQRDADLNADPELDEALQRVLMTSGSDLHVSAGAPPMIRVDGALKPIDGAAPWSADKVKAALYSILTERQKEIFEQELEFDFAYTLSENARFRVNFYQQRHNIGAAFRLIPTEIKPLAALGVPDSIASFAKLPRGLVLITGPTGSGKSTTLAALIDLVNRTRTDHIMTVEDPIEFLHTNHKSLVNQREVGHDTHSFAQALKHVLRQDPDVILVGELRDLETISVALTAAETGHLVFATLHTQDAPQTIDRIIDVYPPHQQAQVRAQLAATLQGVVCQTLVKRSNGRGRVVATEVLMATHAVANLIREGKTYQVHSAMQAGRDLGMHTLDQHLADLVNSGQISFESAIEKAHDFEVLKRLVTRADTSVAAVGANMSSEGVNFADAYSGQF
ncbi:twitching motility protein PilT [Homoserinimonas aerilata]|uniref:Twitching motility protein PilT n=1 Tax=Homoserinimonas aerilata TaxID=1162970 RepID=A0A542Y1H3_9MICO|nr:type IV pilus twitching motility protein PilT [Homoserinimonas aerilata]TQL41924.1 twitching motility protein PilT [Homoserinimonas aerilata]